MDHSQNPGVIHEAAGQIWPYFLEGILEHSHEAFAEPKTNFFFGQTAF
jgi:hypothetical protein